MTKIGDRFIVDISKNFTFSEIFVVAFQNHLIASSRSSTVENRLDTQKVASGTTMRRACELVARRAYCVDSQKNPCVYVRSSVRSFVRPLSRPTRWTPKMVAVMGVWSKKGFQMFKYGHADGSEQ